MRQFLILLVVGCGSVSPVQVDAKKTADAAPSTPSITSLSPTKGIVTTAVTISGTEFGASQGTGAVTIDGKPATVTTWGDTSIIVTVPDVLPADVDVVVTATGGVTPAMKFRVILPPAIYVENNNADATLMSDTVSALAFDPATGATTQIGGPIAKGMALSSYGGCSSSVWLHEHTRRLFTTGATGVAIYDINPMTGGLTPVAGSPFASGTTPYAVVTNTAGTRLFVANYGSSNVAVFDLAVNGVATAVAGSPFAVGFSGDTIALSQDETKLYVNGYGANYEAMSINATGALAVIAPTHVGGTAIQRRPGADLLYIPASNGSLGVWSVDGAGAATAIAGSPFALAPPAGIIDTPAFNTDGSRMYIAPDNSGYIMGYSLAAGGTPTALAGSPWNFTASLTDISCSAVSRDGAYYVAVGEAQQKIGVFSLDAAGTPTQVTNSPFTYLPATASSGGLAITF